MGGVGAYDVFWDETMLGCIVSLFCSAMGPPLYPGSGGGEVNEILRTPLAMQLKPGRRVDLMGH